MKGGGGEKEEDWTRERCADEREEETEERETAAKDKRAKRTIMEIFI